MMENAKQYFDRRLDQMKPGEMVRFEDTLVHQAYGERSCDRLGGEGTTIRNLAFKRGDILVEFEECDIFDSTVKITKL